VPSVAPAHVTGVRFCQESMAANLESERSQESKALARSPTRLWGRGLGDTMSKVVPVGATDYILARRLVTSSARRVLLVALL